LLPIHGFVQARHLVEKGLSHYWGYNTISVFAPYRADLKSGRIRWHPAPSRPAGKAFRFSSADV
jgi:hypothetical protein